MDNWFNKFGRGSDEEDFGRTGTGTEHRTRSNPNYTKQKPSQNNNNNRQQRERDFENGGFRFSGGGSAGNRWSGSGTNNNNQRRDGNDFNSFFAEFVKQATEGVDQNVKLSDYQTKPVLFSEIKDGYSHLPKKKIKSEEEFRPVIEVIESGSDEDNEELAADPGEDKLTEFERLFMDESDKKKNDSGVLVEVVESDPIYKAKQKSVQMIKTGCFACDYYDAYDAPQEGPTRQLFNFIQTMYWQRGYNIESVSIQAEKYYEVNIRIPAQRRGIVLPVWTAEKIKEHYFEHTNDPRIFIGRSINMWSKAQAVAAEHLFAYKVNPKTGESFLQADKNNLEVMKAAETFNERKYMLNEAIMNFSGAKQSDSKAK